MNGIVEEIKEKIFQEINKTKTTIYSNLWNTMQVVLRGMLIAVNAKTKKSKQRNFKIQMNRKYTLRLCLLEIKEKL